MVAFQLTYLTRSAHLLKSSDFAQRQLWPAYLPAHLGHPHYALSLLRKG